MDHNFWEPESFLDASNGTRGLELGETDPSLITGLDLKAHSGDLQTLPLDLGNPPLDDFMAAGKSHVDESIVDSGGGRVVFVEPCHDIVFRENGVAS